jgi:hypothetical protein
MILVDVIGEDEKPIEACDIDIGWIFAFGNEIYGRRSDDVAS